MKRMRSASITAAKVRCTLAAISACLTMFSLAGCGGGNVDRAEQASRAALVRPQAVFVYAFEIDPALVQTDHSLVETLNASLHGQSDSMRQLSLASGVQEALADEIVKELRGKGVPAIRLTDAPPLGQNVLIVRGTFEKVDAGNRASRLVIGLGAGKSQIATSVQLWYQAADGEQMLMESSKASRNSGHMPGMAETLGVGAVAGRLVESAAAGGVFHATSETLRASPIDDAKRVADLIAKRIVKLDSADGWQTAPRTN